MRVSHPAHQSNGAHPSVFAHIALEYHCAAFVDDHHLERRTALLRFAWPDEAHHFVSKSTGNVLAIESESVAVILHCLISFRSSVRLGRSSILPPSNPPRKTRDAHQTPRTS